MVCIGEKYKVKTSDKSINMCPACYSQGEVWEVKCSLPLKLNLMDSECNTNKYIGIDYNELNKNFVKI